MRHILFKIVLLILFAQLSEAQSLSEKQKHDIATENIADVLFDSKVKPIRDKIKGFENSCGIKVQYRVEDESLNQLGGLSEHLFKLFQTFTSNENINAKTITGEYSALNNTALSDVLTYKTNATADLVQCMLPLKDTQKLDSLYNKFLHNNLLSVEDQNNAPESLDGMYSQSVDDYEKILFKNNECPNVFNADAYNQHVVNTRQNRFTSWTSDANALSLSISTDYGLLTSNGSTLGNTNPGSTGINLNIEASLFNGTHVLNLNNSVNTCTQEDMEVRCRMLFKKTNTRFLFITQDLNYFLPADSLTKFRDAATQTFTNNLTDNIIVALYLKMKDGPGFSSGVLLVKQINGTWLTSGDINFANYNNGGEYKAGTFYKFKNLYKNIPKPLILCYQVAKVNGLLTTSYFNKGESIKGREQIYYHVFKTDAAFEEISQLDNQLSGLYSQSGGSSGSIIGTTGVNYTTIYREIDEVKNKIRIAYLKAAMDPKFSEAGIHFKEVYLQNKAVAEAGALKFLRDKYGLLYKNNKFDELIGNTGLPSDLNSGSCKVSDNSDVIGDALNIASLVLSPTGLDFIPDALAVAYYASTDNTYEMLWSSASFLVPGSLSGTKKVISSSADAIKEINAGNKLLIESAQLKSINQDVNEIVSMFNIKPSDVDASLVGKINNNPSVTNNLLPTNTDQAKVYSNTEKLVPEKRLEFVKKCYDDATFRQKVLDDPDEVLRWVGGFVENLVDDGEINVLTKNINYFPGPQLPSKIAYTFENSSYLNRQLGANETFYKYHGTSNRTGRKYSWFTNKKYSTESELREKLAIRSDWGVEIENVTEFNIPSGSWVSEGKAAAQGVGYSGGDYQAVIMNVANTWIIRTDKAFN